MRKLLLLIRPEKICAAVPIIAFMALLALSTGCSVFVPAYDNPISERNVEAKEKKQEQGKPSKQAPK